MSVFGEALQLDGDRLADVFGSISPSSTRNPPIPYWRISLCTVASSLRDRVRVAAGRFVVNTESPAR